MPSIMNWTNKGKKSSMKKQKKAVIVEPNHYINSFEELGWLDPTFSDQKSLNYDKKTSLVNIEFDTPVYKESRMLP